MSKKKPTIKDVEKYCNENGYYIGEHWFPNKPIAKIMGKEELKEIINMVYHNHLTVDYATELIFIQLEKADLIIEKDELIKVLKNQVNQNEDE